MEEAAQGQALIASQKQLLAAIKGVQDQIAQLEKRNKAQGQRCQEESFKEIPPDNFMLLGESTPRKIRNVATKTLKDHPLQKRYYIVSRSKPCQEGGDVVVTKSMVQPESHQTVQTGHLGEGVHPNWNRAKIFTEQEVMNFTSQRFPSPSIYEYPTLEGDFSSKKERPEPKPIIGFNRDPSDFQKAQCQEKWTRKSVVIIQSPKPAKPVLHLPQLEANRFNQLQTRHWRPGDHFNQSGGILGVQEELYMFISCTSNHWIRKILIYFNLPYLESQAFNRQQLFFPSVYARHQHLPDHKEDSQEAHLPPQTVQIQVEHHLHSFGQDSHHKASNG
ncbi:hypothetical protein F2Q68_00026453 [Brassica cretica]|uniref:Uncharacterized protein n=1 Tax=Brassica cretica TaxID=69181 RepID=A0A8S9IAW0_BRACR|nr:hypothetical protein F2Q68_00026453 [Brassica cretica]